MKSIKEKAIEVFPGHCNAYTYESNMKKRTGFVEGANYVLEQVENILRDKNTGLVEMWDELMTLVERLKSNQ